MFSTYFNSLCNKKAAEQAGFGLIELLVSISILVLVVSTILVQQTSFNGSVLLRSQAYEIALKLREVQLTAVSAGFDGDSSVTAQFRQVYGAHFDESLTDGYIIFRDADGDHYFDAGEEWGLQGQIDPRFEIVSVSAVGSSLSEPISITFERPNFDGRFADASGLDEAVTSVEVVIRRIGGTETRIIEITAAGQISVL